MLRKSLGSFAFDFHVGWLCSLISLLTRHKVSLWDIRSAFCSGWIGSEANNVSKLIWRRVFVLQSKAREREKQKQNNKSFVFVFLSPLLLTAKRKHVSKSVCLHCWLHFQSTHCKKLNEYPIGKLCASSVVLVLS